MLDVGVNGFLSNIIIIIITRRLVSINVVRKKINNIHDINSRKYI